MANTKIQSEQIADSAIVTDRIAADAVTTAKIADNVALGGSPTTTTQSASDNSTKIATTAYVTAAVNAIIDSAPDTLNTLNEIAAALNDDADFNTTVTNSIAAKLPLAGGTMTGALNMGSQNITNAGDISGGIFTAETASDYPLRVKSTDSFAGIVLQDSSSTTNGNVISVTGDTMNFFTGGTNSGTDIALTLASNNNATFTGTITSGAITSSGNITAGNNGNINIPTASSGNANLSFDGSDFTIVSNSSSANLKLQTNSQDTVTIAANGNLTHHRGTATFGNSSFGTVTSSGLYLTPSDASDTDAWILYQYTDDTLRINFTGAGEDEIVIKHPNSTNGRTVTIDTDTQRLGIGTTGPARALEVSTDGTAQLRLSRVDTTINGNNTLGTIEFWGNDDTAGTIGATIVGHAASTWGGGAYPTDLRFSTMDGSTLSEAMRITRLGDVSIGSDHGGFSGWRVLNIRGLSATEGGMVNFENSAGTRSATFANQASGIRYQTHISGGYHRFETNGASYALYIPDNGDIHFGGTNKGRLKSASNNTYLDAIPSSSHIIFRNNGAIEKMHITDTGSLYHVEQGNNGDYTSFIGSTCAGGSGNRYLHVQISTAGGDMFWVEVIGYDYGGNSIYGRAGGYVYLYTTSSTVYSGVVTGSIVAQHQNTSAYVELVVDTNSTATSNRWGNYVFRGGTDTITGSQPLEIIQYSYTSTTAKVY
jgi:hypothetical protein